MLGFSLGARLHLKVYFSVYRLHCDVFAQDGLRQGQMVDRVNIKTLSHQSLVRFYFHVENQVTGRAILPPISFLLYLDDSTVFDCGRDHDSFFYLAQAMASAIASFALLWLITHAKAPAFAHNTLFVGHERPVLSRNKPLP